MTVNFKSEEQCVKYHCFQYGLICCQITYELYEGYLEINYIELFTRQAMRKRMCYIQTNTYILKLILDVVTVKTEALVISGNKFCMPVSKNSAACEFSHVSSKPSISSSLLLKRSDPNQFFR
jgi:hypothetical protein